MPVTNEYVITIINGSAGGAATPTAEKEQISGSIPKAWATNQSSSGEAETPTSKLPKQLQGLAIYGYAKSVMNRLAQSSINTVVLRTGHEELQQRIQFTYNIANRGLDLVTSAITGASVGGPAGAIVGVAMNLVSTGVDLAMRQNELNISRQQENTTIFLNQIRIGAGGGRIGRTE
jgi:hypothetical protein